MKMLRTISAILLAILVLFSSTSFLVGLHFCQGEVENVSIFSKAPGCEKEKSLPPCHRHSKVPCCDDEVVFHQGVDFKGSIDPIHFDAPVIAVNQPPVLISEIVPVLEVRIEVSSYPPPVRTCDLTVEHHTLLI